MSDFYARTVFFVNDVDRSMEFYTKQLGFTLDWDSHDGVLQVGLMGFELILNQTWSHATARAGQGRVFIGLDDDQEAPFRKHLAEHSVPLERVQWGRPTLVIRDPDGNELFFWGSDDELSKLGTPVVPPVGN